MTVSSSVFSRNVAASLGERHTRNFSRVLGDGFATAFGSRNSAAAMDVVHSLMLTAVSDVATTPAASRRNRLLLWGGLGTLVWIFGQSSSATSRYQLW